MKIMIRQLRDLIREAVEEAMSCIDEGDEIDQDKDGDTVADALSAAGLPVRPELRKLANQSINSVTLQFDKRPGAPGTYSARVLPNIPLGQELPMVSKFPLTADEHDGRRRADLGVRPRVPKVLLTADEHDAISDYKNAGG